MATNSLRNRTLSLPIVLFMLSCVISGCEGAGTGPSPPDAILSSAAARARGAQLFAAHCAICHGNSGDGEGQDHSFMVPPPANLTVPPWSERASAGRTFLVIRNGIRWTAMAPWPALSDAQRWQLVAYIETLGSQR